MKSAIAANPGGGGVPFLPAFLCLSLSSAAAEPLSSYLLWDDIWQLMQKSLKKTPEQDNESVIQSLINGSHFPHHVCLNLPPNQVWLWVTRPSKEDHGPIKDPLWWARVRTLAHWILFRTPDVRGLVSRLCFSGLRCDFSTVLSPPPSVDKQRGATSRAQAQSDPLGGNDTRLKLIKMNELKQY